MTHCIHLKPGDPGFADLAVQVTPLHRIRKGFSQRKNDITADAAPVASARRNESPDKLRG